MNWGLIGASTIASQYMINAIRAQQGQEISSVLSGSDDRGREFAAKHSIPSSTLNLDELLSDANIGSVYISSTNEKHKPQAMAAIAAGKHVMCEKPLAINVADAVEMVRAAEAAGVVFATNHHLRNAGSHIAIKQLIDDGSLGTVQSIRIFHAVYLPVNLQGWRINNAAAGGGVIPDIVVHDADTIRFYLDEDPQTVVAMEHSGSMGQGVEDSSMAIMQMPSGAMVQTHESFSHRYAGTGLEIHGTGATVRARNIMTQQPIGEIELINDQGVRKISFSNHDLYTRSMKRFVSATNGGGHPSASGIDGVKSLAVAMAVKESASSGQAVTIDYGGT